ncbi:MAG TPA: hypothetical protein PKD78_06900, partial [Saprospiraceae bacterium]|nr:hypothetical protein [Saprospiraceae bacterium]
QKSTTQNSTNYLYRTLSGLFGRKAHRTAPLQRVNEGTCAAAKVVPEIYVASLSDRYTTEAVF